MGDTRPVQSAALSDGMRPPLVFGIAWDGAWSVDDIVVSPFRRPKDGCPNIIMGDDENTLFRPWRETLGEAEPEALSSNSSSNSGA
jgi:hypothetical protein